MQKNDIKVYQFEKKEDCERINKNDKKLTFKKFTSKTFSFSHLFFDSRHFHKYHNIKKLDNLSFKSKYSFLVHFFNHLDKFRGLNTKKREKKTIHMIQLQNYMECV